MFILIIDFRLYDNERAIKNYIFMILSGISL